MTAATPEQESFEATTIPAVVADDLVIERQDFESQVDLIGALDVLPNRIDDTNADIAVKLVALGRALVKEIEVKFEPSRDAANKTHKAIVKLQKDLTKPIDVRVELLRDGIRENENRKRREREAFEARERVRLREEQRAQAAARAPATIVPGTASAPAPVPTAPTPAPPIPPSVPAATPPAHKKTAGVDIVEKWTGRVVDLPALIECVLKGEVRQDLIQVNQKALDELAQSLKGAMPLAGVEWVQDDNIRVR